MTCTKLSSVMCDFLSFSMWLVRLCIQIHLVNYIVYTHITPICGIKRYIHSIHAYGFEIILHILVFKQVMKKGIVDSSKFALKMDMFEHIQR